MYKKRTELKKNPTTAGPPEYTGPPFLDVNWNGHSNLPEEVNNAEILKEILEKVARYKRYEYCPFGNMEKCEKKGVSEIVDEIIDVVLHPTEPPTEPPTQPPVTSGASDREVDDEVSGLDDEDDTSEGTDGSEKAEGTEGEGEAVVPTEEAGGEETSTGEDASEGEATEAPAEEPAEEDS